jgi:hypothetical protein
MRGWEPDAEPTGESYRRIPSRRRRPAGGSLRSAGRRVGSVLGWVGLLVIAPLIVGILAGAIGQHLGI